ncbi:MAG: exonuclease [Rhodospirillales bacterium]|nr:exonuclease [Rhodospirillales bacterium]
MGPRLFLIVCFGGLAAAALLAVVVGVWLIAAALPENGESVRSLVIVYGGGIACLLVAVIAVLWGYLDHALAAPLAAVVRGIQTVVYANAEHRIEVDDDHELGGLPTAVNDLVRKLSQARNNVEDAVAAATRSLEKQKNQLAVILQDLSEGVIVCTLNHSILLYNRQALQLLHIGGDIGLDRSLFTFMTRQPILHCLGRLTNRVAEGRHTDHPDGLMAACVGATSDGRHILDTRMSLILDPEGSASGYVLTFDDNTDELAALGLRDRLLREATEGLRAPVANLSAAAEILGGNPAMDAAQQSQFKQVILSESRFLANRLERLSAYYRDIITAHWPMRDIYSGNLFNHVSCRLREQRDVATVMTGLPQWLHGDSYTLVELLNRLILKVGDLAGATSFDLEAVRGDRHIYIDVAWRGDAVPAAALSSWLADRLDDTLAGLSLREVLDRHRTDIWSLGGRDGGARLRLPLPQAKRSTQGADVRQLPPRPEFYDFGLLSRPGDLGERAQRPLRAITYVAFDTETTGLNPEAGDEIVALAGVRIVNGRILTGESFDRVVDPGREIPAESIRFHGITAEAVKDKPPIQVVLPQFRAFVGDAVLVAHNADFDLTFIRLKERESGVSFAMPVLDTLLLSAYLHDYTGKHSLDVVAKRFGIEVRGRHTALGDALVAAGVFLRMIDVLEARGIRTLDEALVATNALAEARARQARV